MTLGPNADPALLGDIRPRVRVLAYVPQRAVLDRCAVVEPIDAMTVSVAGVAWLLADSSAGDRHPFSATLSLAPSRGALASYVIRFGDTAVGLGPNPMVDRVRSRWPDVASWVFTWVGPTLS